MSDSIGCSEGLVPICGMRVHLDLREWEERRLSSLQWRLEQYRRSKRRSPMLSYMLESWTCALLSQDHEIFGIPSGNDAGFYLLRNFVPGMEKCTSAFDYRRAIMAADWVARFHVGHFTNWDFPEITNEEQCISVAERLHKICEAAHTESIRAVERLDVSDSFKDEIKKEAFAKADWYTARSGASSSGNLSGLNRAHIMAVYTLHESLGFMLESSYMDSAVCLVEQDNSLTCSGTQFVRMERTGPLDTYRAHVWESGLKLLKRMIDIEEEAKAASASQAG